ncbi:MAG: HEAT repeat domain-containing protein, partial [Anaerolineae bacterium]|nr:HEAT repeat domain-containing protein [Anaerolineae bacterium]
LKDSDKYVREAAARALDNLGWQAGQDEGSVAYWIVRGEWDRCVAIGALAVEPLIDALKYEKWNVRRAAARALVSMYHSQVLSHAHKARILAHRSIMAQGHRDHTSSSDCGSHDDTGIGISF